MRLRRLLLASALGLGFIGLNPAVAQADPITAAVAVVSAFASTAVGSFIVNAVATVAVSWASSKLLGKNKSSVAERQASVLTVSLGEVPREALIGETITAGSLVDIFNHGGKYGTDYVTRCIALADHAVEAIVGYYLDDVFYAWTGNGIQPGFNGALDLEFVNATASGTAPPARWLSASGWSNTDVGIGVTRIWISAKYDDEVWTQGLPQLRFVLRGLKAYDARKDAALGYVGPDAQSWDDPTTHRWTRNATVLRYATVRGIYVEGRHGQAEHLLIGRGLTAIEAPPERTIAAANVCDEDVDGDYAPGTTLYTANGTIRASDAFIAVEEMFAAAMAGQIVQREGGVEIEPGQAKAAVVSITDGDLVVGEPVRFSPFLPDADGGRINTVVPRYVEPGQNWKDFAGPVRRSLDDIAEDGGPREMTLSLILVTDGRQADWCAEIVRRSSRLERRASIVLPPDYAVLEEGDWIAWQSDRRHDGATVRYRIESWSLGADWRMRLNLTEIASSVFGTPDPVETGALPPPVPVPVDALELDGVTAEAITLPGATSTMPAVRFRWDTPVDVAVLAVRAEIRKVGETEIAPTRFEDLSSGEMVASNGVPADAAIEARLVPIGDATRPVLPSVWFTLSTVPLVAGDVSPSSPVIASILTDIEDLVEVYGDTVASAASAAASAAAASAAELARDGAVTAEGAAAGSASYADGKAGESAASATASFNSATVAGAQASSSAASAAAAAASEVAAQNSAALSARIGLGTLNGYPTFAVYADASLTGIPNGWGAWGDCRDQHRAAGRFSDWAFWQHNNKDGVTTECGLYQDYSSCSGLTSMNPGWYVLGADIRHEAGQIGGAGVYFYCTGGGTTAAIDFANDIPVGETAPLGATYSTARTFSFRKLVHITDVGSAKQGVFHLMTDWVGFDATRRPKIMIWDRCDVRPATDMEVAAQRADENASAALAQITVEETVRASETAALASRSTALEALTSTAPNLLPNSDFSQGALKWNHGGVFAFNTTNVTIGSYAICSAAGDNGLQSDAFDLEPNTTYSFSFEGDGGSVPSAAAVYITEYQSDGTTIVADGSGLTTFAGVGWFVPKQGVTFTTNAATHKGRFFVLKPAGSSYVAVTRIMVHLGSSKVRWNDDATAKSVAARITVEEATRASETAALASTQTALSSTVGALSSTVTSQAITLATVDGIARAIVGVELDVGGYISGTRSENDGVTSSFDVQTDVFRLVDPGGGTRTEYEDGIWRTYDSANARVLLTGKPFGATSDLMMWLGPDTATPSTASKVDVNCQFALAPDGIWRKGTRQDALYSEAFVSSPLNVGTTLADVATFTLSRSVGLTELFNVAMGLTISTPTPRTRGSSTTTAPGGAWEVWELPASGTANQRKVASGSWTSQIVGAGGSAVNVTLFDINSEGDNWSDVSRQWRFRHGGQERFVLKMSTGGGPTLLDVIVNLRVSVQSYS